MTLNIVAVTEGGLTIDSTQPYSFDFPDITFRLDLTDRHESSYFESLTGSKKVLDHIVAENFINDGDVVVDVGANIGFCSLVYLMNGASKVIAFEPHPTIYERLESLSHDKLITSDIALTDGYNPDDTLILSSSHNQGHTLNPIIASEFDKVFDPEPETVSVCTNTLDGVTSPPIDFLKVDIEGSELNFLKGANCTLAKAPPRVLHIEVYPLEFEETMNVLRLYFEYIKRCVVMQTGEIKLIGSRGDPKSIKGADLQHPPTFICVNDPEVIRPFT